METASRKIPGRLFCPQRVTLTNYQLIWGRNCSASLPLMETDLILQLMLYGAQWDQAEAGVLLKSCLCPDLLLCPAALTASQVFPVSTPSITCTNIPTSGSASREPALRCSQEKWHSPLLSHIYPFFLQCTFQKEPFYICLQVYSFLSVSILVMNSVKVGTVLFYLPCNPNSSTMPSTMRGRTPKLSERWMHVWLWCLSSRWAELGSRRHAHMVSWTMAWKLCGAPLWVSKGKYLGSQASSIYILVSWEEREGGRKEEHSMAKWCHFFIYLRVMRKLMFSDIRPLTCSRHNISKSLRT